MSDGSGGTRSNVLVLASLTLSMISLFVAISGAANAGNQKLPANSVGPRELKPDAVTPPDIAKGAVLPDALGRGAVTSEALATSSVTPTALAPNSVTAPALAPNSVQAGKIKDGAVTKPTIAPGAVVSASLAPGAVTGPKIGPKAVGAVALADKAVQSSNIADGAVTNAGLANGAVGPSAIATLPSASISATSPVATTDNPGGGDVWILPENSDAPPIFDNGTPFQPHILNFDTTNFDNASMFDQANAPYGLEIPRDGMYSVTLNGTWAPGTGRVRTLSVAAIFDAGGGLVYLPFNDATGIPSGSDPTSVSQTVTQQLSAGDVLIVAAASAGQPGTLQKATISATWTGPPAS